MFSYFMVIIDPQAVLSGYFSKTMNYEGGRTRCLKIRRWREKRPGENPYTKISNTMSRVVGEKAAEFSDCSRWVRDFCPLNSRYVN